MGSNKDPEIETTLAALNGSAEDWEIFLSARKDASIVLAGVS